MDYLFKMVYAFTKVIGKTIKHMEKENTAQQRDRLIKEIFRMIKYGEKEHILMQMVKLFKEIRLMIKKMDM